MWDLERENCIAQLNLPAGGASGGGAASSAAAAAHKPAVEHLAASASSPLLYAGDANGAGARGWRAGGPGSVGRSGCVQGLLQAGCSPAPGPRCCSPDPHRPARPLLLLPASSPPRPAVRIFDLRSSEVAGSAQHLRGRLAGMAAEPGGAAHTLVLGYPNGQLAFLDCRMLR